MRRFWNSLQFRLYATFGAMIVFIAIIVIVGIQTQNQLFNRNDHTRASTELTANAYKILTLAHRYIDAPTESARADIKASIDSTVEDTDQLLTDLLHGSVEHDTPALDLPEMLSIRNDIQTEWNDIPPILQELYASDRSQYEAQVVELDKESYDIPELGEKLSEAIDVAATQEKANADSVTEVILVALVIALVFAPIVVFRTVHSIKKLEQTAQAFANGNFNARANTQTLNEISVVGTTFNSMADRISQLLRDLEQQVVVAEQARVRAEKADQVKSSFLASVSHELRTPLNAIINFSKFVIKGVMGPVTEQQTDALNKVVHSGTHLLNLINDVLDISKIESGSLSLFLEPNIDIGDILRQTTAISDALLEAKPVRLDMDIAPDLPTIYADRQRIRQIVTNLLSNACKFTEEGFIKITASQQDKAILISVQDTGPGIAKEDFDLVFESFKQTSTGLRSGSGTGLGMPISKSLAEALGGKLWFESEVGKGSTFFVQLPVKTTEPVKVLA